jgi:hypothetical protein
MAGPFHLMWTYVGHNLTAWFERQRGGREFMQFQLRFTQFSSDFHDFSASLSSTPRVSLGCCGRLAATQRVFSQLIGQSGFRMEFIMSCRLSLSASVAALVLAGTPYAQPLRPIQAQEVDLRTLAGVAYHTVEPDGSPGPHSAGAAIRYAVPCCGDSCAEQTVTLCVPHKVQKPVWVNRGDAAAPLEAHSD